VPQFLRTMHQTVTELAGASADEKPAHDGTQGESFTRAVTAQFARLSRSQHLDHRWQAGQESKRPFDDGAA
jgi:hypothetical protein